MSSIPNLTRAHVESAIARIEREGVPPKRESTHYQLVVGTRRYPPKYVISLAAAEATGRELGPDEFYGGKETNAALESLGFFSERLPGKAPDRNRRAMPSACSPAAPSSRATVTGRLQPIVRVVVQGEPASSHQAAAEMLLEALGPKWPASTSAKFTITPGGFISGRFPANWTGGVGWESRPGDLSTLAKVARPLVESTVTRKVLDAAKTRTGILTIGVDLLSDAEHAEFVAIMDCSSGEIVHWTGKSYPTGAQAAQLVQVSDLASHLLEIAEERVLVLGCHDLNMFSARARANQAPGGIRRKRCDAMARLVARFRPTVVLQHPHSTDAPNIWRMPWACLARDYPSVRFYASGIGYYAWSGKPRRAIQDVLDGTRSKSGVVDVIVKSR